MEWFYLVIAGFFEAGWAIGLKYSQGFTKMVPSILTVIGMIASIYFLSAALKNLPIGTAYAIWTGIGTVGTVILGSILFKEAFDIKSIICVLLIISGIVGLKLTSLN